MSSQVQHLVKRKLDDGGSVVFNGNIQGKTVNFFSGRLIHCHEFDLYLFIFGSRRLIMFSL